MEKSRHLSVNGPLYTGEHLSQDQAPHLGLLSEAKGVGQANVIR